MPCAAQIAHEDYATGTATSGTTVVTSSITGGTNQAYVLATSVRLDVSVSTVEDSLSAMTWNQQVDRCGDRTQTGIDLWTAYGSPGASFTVIVTYGSTIVAAVAAVHRYSGVDSGSPFAGAVMSNTGG